MSSSRPRLRLLLPLAISIALAGCGGSDDYRSGSVLPKPFGLPQGLPALDFVFPPGTVKRYDLPRPSGGIRPYSYSVTGDCEGLVEGNGGWLRLDDNRLAGSAPAQASDSTYSCVYTARDSSSSPQSASLPFRLRVGVLRSTDFQFENQVIPERNFTRGTEIVPIGLPRVLNGVPPYSYQIQPALPSGLILTCPGGSTSRTDCVVSKEHVDERVVLSGTPDTITTITEYQWHGSDSTGVELDPKRFHVRVVGHDVPRFTVILGLAQPWQVLSAERTSTEGPNPPPYPLDPSSVSFSLYPAHLPDSWDRSLVQYSIDPEVLPPLTFTSAGADVTPTLTWTRDMLTPPSLPPASVVYTYGVKRSEGGAFSVAICLDVEIQTTDDSVTRTDTVTIPGIDGGEPTTEEVPSTSHFLVHSMRIVPREEAVTSSTGEYICHPNPRGDDDPSSGAASPLQSNPVHDALGMVHARRATSFVHDFVEDQVRTSVSRPHPLSFLSNLGFSSLSGEVQGFGYSGSSESLLVGASSRLDSLQLGVLGSFTRSDLRYQALSSHLTQSYSRGTHRTEIASAHPFAAYHHASRGSVWASFGVGSGRLWYQDAKPPFSRPASSSLELVTYAAGGLFPLSTLAGGEVLLRTRFEHTSFAIEGSDDSGGIRPRDLAGSDLALGLAWSGAVLDLPLRAVPDLSVGYVARRGDGPEGGSIDTRASLEVLPFGPLLSLRAGLGAQFGVGSYQSDSWDLSGSMRLGRSGSSRGMSASLDTAVTGSDSLRSPRPRLRAEVGYGLAPSVLAGSRPFVSLSGNGDDLRRALGIDLVDDPGYRVRVQAYDGRSGPGVLASVRRQLVPR